jgi:hypothetical protein
MTSQQAPSDAGFVIVDALMAIGLVAAAGTMVTLSTLGILQRQGEELDRSVALVMSQALMRQYLVLDGTQRTHLEAHDELFSYGVDEDTENDLSLVRKAVVLATAKSGEVDSQLRLEFLTPATGTMP